MRSRVCVCPAGASKADALAAAEKQVFLVAQSGWCTARRPNAAVETAVDSDVHKGLVADGWAEHGRWILFAKPVGDAGDAGDDHAQVDLAPQGDAEWHAVLARSLGKGEDEMTGRRAVFDRRPAGSQRFMAVRRGGRIVAIGHVAWSGGVAVMSNKWVDPDCRRQGLARQLHRAGEAAARGGGARVVCAQVFADNAGAIALNERAGFGVLGSFVVLGPPGAAPARLGAHSC